MALLSRRGSRPARLAAPDGASVVLHVGCGPPDHMTLHERYRGPEWVELRLDVDPGVRPDIVASITDMSPVPDRSVDAVYSHHNIEHIFAHEVPRAFGEFLRVLRPGGEALIATPDLEAVGKALAAGRLEEVLYRAQAGDICALDIVYGLRSDIEGGREYMAHRTGFSARTLGRRLRQAGFVDVQTTHAAGCGLWARGRRPPG